jgi:hypothetical protein
MYKVFAPAGQPAFCEEQPAKIGCSSGAIFIFSLHHLLQTGYASGVFYFRSLFY